MKKLLLCFALLCSSAWAEDITIVWGFSLGSTQANSVRHIIDEANAAQSKYKFLIDNKQGAGGSIAANYVYENANTVLAMSSSFFVRPFYETTGTHNLNNFQPVLVQGFGSPVALVSKKYKTFDEFKKGKDLSAGIAGMGTMSHIVAEQLNQTTNNIRLIPFKSMVDAGVAVAGGHLDVALVFYTDVKPFIDSGDVNVLAYTGQVDIGNNKNKTFEKLGLPSLTKLTANYGMYVSKDMPAGKVKELHAILSAANSKQSVIESYKVDNLTPVNYNYSNTVSWYTQEFQHWQTQVNRIKSKQ